MDAVSEKAFEIVDQNILIGSLSNESDFLDLSHDVIVEFLRRIDGIITPGAYEESLKRILNWAIAQRTAVDTVMEQGTTDDDNIMYKGKPGERIVDLIRFGCISPEVFLEISRVGLLKDEDRIKWLEFHLEDSSKQIKKWREEKDRKLRSGLGRFSSAGQALMIEEEDRERSLEKLRRELRKRI